VLDYVVDQSPNSELVIYEHWPQPNLADGIGNNANMADLTESERQFYRAYTSGGYHDWHIQWQNLIVARYPNSVVRMIPVGPIIADLIENEPYMASAAYTELYADDSPHGSRTIYFLAALITYRVLYEESPNSNFDAPDYILEEVRNNLPAVVSYIDERVSHYNANGTRVFID
jgi:hypothetical protein